MRTINELLKLMLSHQNLFQWGFCGWIRIMWLLDLITTDEYYQIKNYLKIHNISYEGGYWWPKGEIQPRIDWLNKHIILTEPNNQPEPCTK